jgi:hypothetical protein
MQEKKGASKPRMNWREIQSDLARHRTIVILSGLFIVLAVVLAFMWPDEHKDFRAAAERIEKNYLPGEVIILHPPGNAWHSKPFNRFPTISPLKLKAKDIKGLAGMWVVTPDKARARKVFRGAIKTFRKQGEASFGDLTLLHYWKPKGDQGL